MSIKPIRYLSYVPDSLIVLPRWRKVKSDFLREQQAAFFFFANFIVLSCPKQKCSSGGILYFAKDKHQLCAMCFQNPIKIKVNEWCAVIRVIFDVYRFFAYGRHMLLRGKNIVFQRARTLTHREKKNSNKIILFFTSLRLNLLINIVCLLGFDQTVA